MHQKECGALHLTINEHTSITEENAIYQSARSALHSLT